MAVQTDGGGGAAGGMDWAALGSQILNDSLTSMEFFTDFMNKEDEKDFRNKSFAENRRQFEKSLKADDRTRNMSGLQLLGQSREKAEMQSRMRRFAKKL